MAVPYVDSLSQTPVALLSQRAVRAPVDIARTHSLYQSTLTANLRSLNSVQAAGKKSQYVLIVLVVLALNCATPQIGAALTRGIGASSTHPNGPPDGARQACQAVAGKSALQLALRHYIKAAVPLPRRFLIAAGTDSGMSDAAMKTLVEFGPTYYYAGSEAVKAKLRDKLTTVGPWPALLVVLRGDKKIGTSTEIIRLGGHYVTGEFDGQHAVSREYTMSCGAAGWTLKSVKEEKGA